MDGQTALICVGVVVVSAIVIILISWCSMQERSFDDVMEEQRKLHAESTVLTKSKYEKEKEKKQERKLKRRMKKGKGDKSDGAEEKEEEAETHKMVELELEPEIIEPEQIKPQVAQESAAAPPHPKAGKKKKEKRSILLNKEEHSYINQEPVQESFHPEHLPKDEVEMLHNRSRTPTPTPIEEVEPKLSKKERKAKRVEVPEDIVCVEEVLQMQSEASTKKNKKHKVDVGAGDSPAVSSPLFTSVREATLNDSDIQALIDILLNKQGAPAREWTKKSQKGDPMSLLRKQLEDREKALHEEQQTATLTSGKLKELRSELATERSRYLGLEKSSQDKIGTQEQEIKALHARMQYTHEQHVKEINTLQESLKKMSEVTDVNLVQRISEENNRLKEQTAKAEAAGLSLEGMDNLQKHLKMLQEELGKNVAKLNMSENAKSNLEIKINRYEEQINKLLTDKKESESVLDRKVAEMNDELRRAESRNNSLQRDLDNHKNMANKLKDAEKVKYELENQIKSVEGRLGEVEKQNQIKDTQLKQLHQENSMLSEQLKTTKERTAGEGQEAPHAGNKPNGDVNIQTKEDITVLLKAEHDKLLHEKQEEMSHLQADFNKTLCEKNAELQKLQEDLHNRLSQIEKISTDLDSQRKKNDELRAKNWKAMDALNLANKQAEAASELKAELARKESEIKLLNGRLEEHSTDHNELAVAEQRATQLASELAQKENQLEEAQSKLAEAEARLDTLETTKVELVAAKESAAGVVEEATRLKAELTSKNTELTSLQEQLSCVTQLKQDLEVRNADLTSAVASGHLAGEETNKLRDELNNKMTELANLQEKLTALSQQNQGLESEITTAKEHLNSQSDSLKKEYEAKITELQAKGTELETLKTELHQLQEQHHALQQEKQTAEEQLKSSKQPADEVNKLRQELNSKLTVLQSITEELEVAKRENNELREKNSKASDALTKAEKALSESVGSGATSTESHSRHILKRLFPKVSVSDSLSHDEWLSHFEKEASEYISSLSSDDTDVADLLSQIEESKENNAKLLSQVQQYKVVVAETEGILNKLQSSVESEEQIWKQRISTAEDQATKAQIEVNRLQDQLQSNSNGTTELEEKVKQLEVRLCSTQEEKDSLKCKLSEGMTNGTGASPEVTELKGKIAGLQRQLDQEIQANKQLSQKLDASATSLDAGKSV